jgi:hypothetical protein
VAGPCEPESGLLSRACGPLCLELPVVGVWNAFRSASSRDGVGWFWAEPAAGHVIQAASTKIRQYRSIATLHVSSGNVPGTVRFRPLVCEAWRDRIDLMYGTEHMRYKFGIIEPASASIGD